MIEELHVRDLALIQEVWLEFGHGMTVLTGETGAGKTALLGALKLLLGERADSGSVRGGTPEALVEGRFRAKGAELLAKRRVGSDGRSRCTVNGEMATVGQLADRVGPLVDLHGQHEHQALLSPQTHLGYLDRWASETVACPYELYAQCFDAFRYAQRDFESARATVDQAARDADYLAFVADEIGSVDPKVGEDEELRGRLPALQHAERLAEATSDAARLLRGEDSALDRVAQAAAVLAKVEGIDPKVDDLRDRMGEIQTLLDDVGGASRQYRDSVEHNPQLLDSTLSRLSALAGLVKKYGPSLDDVVRRREEALAALAVLSDGEGVLRAASERVSRAKTALLEAAAELDTARKAAVPGFVAALSAATHDLAMEGARFDVAFTELTFDHWTADGPHRLEFTYAAASGQPFRPLARIASGGEVSRVMLALKGVLGGADTVETLVFDEVDAGIGGATATAVGQRLALLAKTHQVIVVTHLAQVAAFADAHLVVTKDVSDEGASTSVLCVDGESRVAEIGRMLSGNDSDASRAHAAELLAAARSAVTAF